MNTHPNKQNSHTDYYPFGMMMPGRVTSSDKYRFGYNGQEKDDELKGEGNSLDFGERIYDSRLSRFLSRDPLESTYAWQSTYVFAHNSPIALIDWKGMGDPPKNGDTRTIDDCTEVFDQSLSYGGKEGVWRDKRPDKIIGIAFPDKSADIPSNQKPAKWIDKYLGDNDGKFKVGHAGIVIIDGESGETRYFDFGR